MPPGLSREGKSICGNKTARLAKQRYVLDNLNTSYSKILTEGKNNLRTDHTINPIKVYVILAVNSPTYNGKIGDLAAIFR